MTEILHPAITLAKEGYPVHQFSSLLQKQYKRVLQKTKHSFGDDMLNDNGESPHHGDVMKNPKLASVFEVVSFLINKDCFTLRCSASFQSKLNAHSNVVSIKT